MQRLQILQWLRKHPKWGLPRLRRCIRDLPRNAAADYVRRAKAVLARRRRRNWRRLCWLVPGAVWAVDGTWMEHPVEGRSRRALIVVDLHSRGVLALQAVPGERASAVIALLTRLIAVHGPPLVLKADNGSAFIAVCVARFCRRHGITLMHSPVRRPRWNGTCEVSGRWAKRRAMAAAHCRGAAGQLTQADLDVAVTCAAPLPCVDDGLRERFCAAYAEQLVTVCRERGLVLDHHSADHVRRSLGRVAAQRALQLCHILMIEGREYRQCLPASAA